MSKQIKVSRKGTVWYDDFYEVPEITKENIEKCIRDDGNFFVESELLYETWEETGEIEVTDWETGDELYNPETCEIIIPNNENN